MTNDHNNLHLHDNSTLTKKISTLEGRQHLVPEYLKYFFLDICQF